MARRTIIVSMDIPGVATRAVPAFRALPGDHRIHDASWCQELAVDGTKSARFAGESQPTDQEGAPLTTISGLGALAGVRCPITDWQNPTLAGFRPGGSSRWFGSAVHPTTGGPARSHMRVDYNVTVAGAVAPGACSMLLEIDSGPTGHIGG